MFDSAQGSLFGEGEDRMQAPAADTRPDPDRLRIRLNKIITKAREAETMPWSEREVRMWRKIFPNMVSWLPEDEGRRLLAEFTAELDRLS
ncbi:MAG: hypothetical protein ACFE0P_01900 [Oceanicaulis sp.]